MKFTFSKEQEAFRDEVREFAMGELEAGAFTVESRGLVAERNLEFSRKMAERGWIGLTWPGEYGGGGRGYVDKMIMYEELFRVQAPVGYHFLAERQIGPALIQFGTDWQKDFFLPRIVRVDEGVMFCLLFSEPNAGSDLAAVATSARKEGEYYIVNGQKVWTSEAHTADYGWLLARTDPDRSVPPHQTCSEFIVHMKQPGITVRPIINMAGEHTFNEVFFDDVKIHEKNLVGRENAGFRQIMAQVDYERAGIERLMQNYPVYEQLLDHVKCMDRETEEFTWARDTVARLEIEYHAGRLLCYQTAWTIDQGRKPTSRAALCKAFCTQYEQRLNDTATRII
ncbi:MAG: acyl-CoA dehydrogenase family protein, partial [Deltaproteobacteria bacterium]|nr:acyl-CoA dehydrogenase family protein [Deltaproteobacteria bacterium]